MTEIQTIVRRVTSDDVSAVARLHYEIIGRTGNGSLASLGPEFLMQVLYPASLRNHHFFCDVAECDGELVGFSAFTDDRAGLRSFDLLIRAADAALPLGRHQ